MLDTARGSIAGTLAVPSYERAWLLAERKHKRFISDRFVDSDTIEEKEVKRSLTRAIVSHGEH